MKTDLQGGNPDLVIDAQPRRSERDMEVPPINTCDMDLNLPEQLGSNIHNFAATQARESCKVARRK
jgi:hypothetical protein